MAQVINTNVLSLNSQRNLTKSQGSLATALERLSSGLRINSAKDDAAGLAISDRFTAQIRGLNQAVRNANDGISFAQTAEGALSTIGDALQRMREIAVQSANDSNASSDRTALNNELEQLVAEVSRVANATEFNGERILDGTLSNLFFQVGSNQGQTIGVDGVDARTTELGGTHILGAEGATLEQIASGLSVAANTSITISVGKVGTTTPSTPISVTVNINGGAAGKVTMESIVRDVNSEIRATVNGTSTLNTLSADDRETLSKADLSAATVVKDDGTTSVNLRAGFDVSFSTTSSMSATVVGTTTSLRLMGAASGNQAMTQTNLTQVSVTTREKAALAIDTIDKALTQISNLRSELGAVQIRFENTISNLTVSSENLTSARSRIMDADFAQETANLTRAQILQQAGVAMLAQANALPQNVLALLR